MIISHRHRFIYIKPLKVAGTSVEVALASHCGPDDVVTPQREFTRVFDKDEFTHTARNYEGFSEHMSPAEIRERIGDDVWSAYRKIAVVRNPWDYVVSRYLWEYTKMYRANPYRTLYLRAKHVLLRFWFSHVDPRPFYSIFNFRSFTNAIPDGFVNHRYYFDENGRPHCDTVLRYESLQSDYDKLCAELGIPSTTLPRINTNHKRKRRHYTHYYDADTRQSVARRMKKEIEYFGYEFGQSLSKGP